jgi:hypothetical protein
MTIVIQIIVKCRAQNELADYCDKNVKITFADFERKKPFIIEIEWGKIE